MVVTLLRFLDHEHVQFAKKAATLMTTFSPAERSALTKIIEAIAASNSALARVARSPTQRKIKSGEIGGRDTVRHPRFCSHGHRCDCKQILQRKCASHENRANPMSHARLCHTNRSGHDSYL